jgi:trans-aconitate methyltransferase
MSRTTHWNAIYTTKSDQDVSWFEPQPDVSLRLMDAVGLDAATCVIDIGGGDSRLVDVLIARGLGCVAVLDVSGAALARARTRLGSASSIPTWIEADVTGNWRAQPMDVWHDRAVFHFLVDPADRARYVEHLRETLKVGGAAIIATFAPDGPATCSGLPVARYSPEALSQELGADLTLVETVLHTHTTPWGAPQSLQYSRFQRTA